MATASSRLNTLRDRAHGGGGAGKVEKVWRWAFAAAAAALFAFTAGGWGPFILGVVLVPWIVFDIKKHPAHALRYAGAVAVFMCVVLPNVVLGDPTVSTAHAFGSAGENIKNAIVNRWNERGVQVNVTPTPPSFPSGPVVAPPVTTAPPVVPAVAHP